MRVLLALLCICLSSTSWAQDALDPATDAGEDVAGFQKGQGNGPKNGNSIVPKGIKLKNPKINGTGCQAGTVSATLTPDGKTMSIIFDNYIAQAGNSVGLKRDVKMCGIDIPIEVPPGLQFTVVKLDYRGYNMIPNNGRTRYVTMYSLWDANSKKIGRRVRRKFDFDGPLNDGYMLSADIAANPIWSQCGTSATLRIDTRIGAISNKKGEDTMASIDSIDGSANSTTAQYYFLWQNCGAPPTPQCPPGWVHGSKGCQPPQPPQVQCPPGHIPNKFGCVPQGPGGGKVGGHLGGGFGPPLTPPNGPGGNFGFGCPPGFVKLPNGQCHKI